MYVNSKSAHFCPADQLSGDKTIGSGNGDSSVLKKYKNDKILIRMLVAPHRPTYNRIDWELEELVGAGARRVSCTSLLPYDIPVTPFREIGLMLDAEKCEFRAYFAVGGGMYRVDLCNRPVRWSQSKRSYVTTGEVCECVPKGNLKLRSIGGADRKVQKSSLAEVKQYMIEKRIPGIESTYSDIIVDYNPEAILGIICAMNFCLRVVDEDEMKRHALAVRDRIFSSLDIKLEIFLYDCKTASLNLFDETAGAP